MILQGAEGNQRPEQETQSGFLDRFPDRFHASHCLSKVVLKAVAGVVVLSKNGSPSYLSEFPPRYEIIATRTPCSTGAPIHPDPVLCSGHIRIRGRDQTIKQHGMVQTHGLYLPFLRFVEEFDDSTPTRFTIPVPPFLLRFAEEGTRVF